MPHVDLGHQEPYDAPGVFAFLAARAVAGVERATLSTESLTYARSLTLPSGPGAIELVASRCGAGWDLRARLELEAVEDEEKALAVARRLLDLGHDAAACDETLAHDPALRARVAAVPGIRVPGTVDLGELLVRAVVGQQISVTAATAHLGRLVEAAGAAYDSGIAGVSRVWPSPEQILAAVPAPPAEGPPDPTRPLRLPRRSVATVLACCRDLVDGPVAADRESLVARAGIGPWTAAYVAMRATGDRDAWLTGDVALVAGARRLGVLTEGPQGRADHRMLAARAEAWSPWRAYAAMHLWQVAAHRGDAGQ